MATNGVRPPGTTVPDGLMFHRRCFSMPNLRAPSAIAVKLRHIMGSWLSFIMHVQKFGGAPPPPPKKNREPKTISVNFVPLQTLIVNISGMRQHIQNRNSTRLRTIPPAFDEKSAVKLQSSNYRRMITHS